ASGPRPGASTSCTSTTAATRSTPVPTGTPTSVRATSPPTTSSRWSATPVPRPSSRPRAPRSSRGPTSRGCGSGSADSGPGEQLGGLPPRRGDRRGRRRLQALGRELDQVGERGLCDQVRRPANSYDRAQLVRCTVRGRYEATSWSPWVAARATVRAGRRRGAPVGGRLRSPRPANSYNGAQLVRCTVRARYGATSSSEWVVARAGVRAGGWPGDAPAGRAGPGWGTRAPETGQAPAPPQPRLANSYSRAQLVRCTVRARYGATSSRPRRIHGGSTADPGQAAPGLCRPGRGPRYSAIASLAASCACARASATGMRPANMSGK